MIIYFGASVVARLVQKSWNKTQPSKTLITYNQFARYLDLWFGGMMGTSPDEFRKLFATSSGSSGAALVATDAGMSFELWGQDGVWASCEVQKVYI
jgi:hypothetical protein